jgi:hypothetical protein
MKFMKSVQATLSIAGLLLASITIAMAQTPKPVRPRYDPATEVTLTGTVEGVREIPHGTWSAGLHLILKTEQGAVEVHVGPAMFVATHGMTLAKGDRISVTGSKVHLDGGDALLAREIKKGDTSLKLRDSQGIPEWSRGRRRSQ